MSKFRNGLVAALIAAASAIAAITAADAAAFFGWRVTDVPPGDTLNVRAYPSSGSKILVAYPNGTPLSLTGPCTGAVHLDQISGLAKWKQRELVRYRWCQAWVDPHGSGDFRTGWVYGKFVRPM